MDRDTVWNHIHVERAALAETLATLTPTQWEHESQCAGWTVKDVAAHVISNPQLGLGTVTKLFARNLGRGYNTMIFRETKRLAASQSTEQILADFATYADSRKHVATTTVIEPMLDALVHHQDIVRPLGIRHDMAPDAAAVAADRCRALSLLMGSRQVVRSVRMVATDFDWTRGRGPSVKAPMQELLMLCAGRAADAALVSGDGLEMVTTRR
jgi:uncharacterized protein (TIGR03083 family)